MLRERGPRATNQTKNILTNLPGRQPQPYKTWKFRPESGFMKERFNESYQPTNNKTYNLEVASNSFYNIYDICNNYTKNSARGWARPIFVFFARVIFSLKFFS